MSSFEAYRVWLKDGTYVIAVEQNRQRAVNLAVREKGVKRSQIKAVGRATSRGRLYKYPFLGDILFN